MLLGEQGGRRQKRDLASAGDSHECGAQRDLGFTEADIAADQSVHGAGRDHVLDNGMYRAALVGGFFEAEIVGKALVVGGAVTEGVAFARLTSRIDI